MISRMHQTPSILWKLCLLGLAASKSNFLSAQSTSGDVSDSQTVKPAKETETESGEFVITGQIAIKGSNGFVFDAIVAESANKETVTRTDKEGKFSLKIRSNKIFVRADGFDDLEVQVENGQLPNEGVLAMEKSASISSVGIIRARKKQEISQTTIQRKELERIPGTGGDAVRGLQTLPSVLPAGLGSANLVVRGGAPGDNRYFLDRIEVPFVFHFGGLGTVVPTRMLESVDLYPGGFSSQYGDATGGIIQMRTENATPQKASGQFELGLTQSSLYYEDKTENDMGYRIGFRRTYLELYKPIILKAAKGRLGLFTLPQATDYQVILNGKSKNGTWQAYLLGASDKLELAFPSQLADQGNGRAKFKVSNYFETMGYRHNLNLGQGWGFSLSPQQTYLKIRQEFFSNVIDIRSHTFSLDTTLDKRFSSKARLSLLLRPQIERNTVTIDAIQFPAGGPNVFFDPDTAPRANYKLTNYATPVLYGADFLYTPVKGFDLNPSLSVLSGSGRNENEFDPRLSVRYAFMEKQAVKAAWGYYSQRAEPQYTSKNYGNPDLKLERAVHNVLGIESQWDSSWESDVQLFTKDFINLVGPAVANPDKKYENNTIGRAKGLELLVKKSNTGKWYGWLSYGYSVSERRDPENLKWSYSQYDRPHSLTFLSSYRITGRWQLGGKLQYLSGSPYTKVTEGYFNQNTGRYQAIEATSKQARLPSTSQLDVRSDYEFYLDRWTLNWYIEVLNATNRKNVVGTRRSKDFSLEEKIYGSPIIPTTGIIASF